MENQQIGLQSVHELEVEKTNPRITLSKKQMEQLCKYLSEQQFTTSSSHIIQKGITLTAFSGMTGKGKPSIIGSGATDHMIEYKKLFTSYVPSPQNHRVKIVDRTRFREGRLAMLRNSKGYTTSRRTFLCVVEFKLLCAILP
ncbi:hypothetical protein AAG906_038852 [Vitis piasezkii]